VPGQCTGFFGCDDEADTRTDPTGMEDRHRNRAGTGPLLLVGHRESLGTDLLKLFGKQAGFATVRGATWSSGCRR
jgi:hypothetical protein